MIQISKLLLILKSWIEATTPNILFVAGIIFKVRTSFSLGKIFSLFYLRPSSAISVMGSTDPWGNCGADPTNIIVFLEIIRRIADTFTLNIITGYRLMEFRSAGSPPPQKKIGIAVDKPIVFGKILDFTPLKSKFTHLKCWRGKILSNYFETSG